MTKKTPTISIGMPLYNGKRFIEAALESLLAQTFDDFEIIISDNASTDGGSALCRRYAARDPRIRYQRQGENRGSVWNFNRVVQLARGEYFKWAAHDDVCAPTFLEQCLEALSTNRHAVLSFPQTTLIDGDGNPLDVDDDNHHDEGELALATPHERFRELLLHRVWVHEIYGLIRIKALRATRLLPAYVGAEKILFAELAMQGTFVQVPEPLFQCRWHDDQASWIQSAADERRWRNPLRRGPVLIPRHVSCAVGQFLAVARADLPSRERLRCLKALSQWIFQVRKWKRLAGDYIGNVGSGGRRDGSNSGGSSGMQQMSPLA